MGSYLATKVLVAPGETEDCDFLTKARVDDTEVFSCVQLKELTSEDRNPTQTLDSLVAGLRNRPQSDAVLAIYLNRRGQIPLAELAALRVPFAELWYFWAASPDANQWRLFGDAMGTPSLHEFEYPQ
jgi:hypothetical protein